MADRRIKDLTPVASLDANFKVAVDKTGESEVGSATLQQLADLISAVRRGSQSVTVDTEATVTFASAFASLTYALMVKCYDSNGNEVSVKITDRGLSSFKATPAANGTLNYLAIAI